MFARNAWDHNSLLARTHTKKKKHLHFRVLLLKQARLITASFIKKTHTSLFYSHLQRYIWEIWQIWELIVLSLFFFGLSEMSVPRASLERRSHETREARAAAPEEKRDTALFSPLPRLAPSVTCVIIFVSRTFRATDLEKRETPVCSLILKSSLIISIVFSWCERPSFSTRLLFSGA